MRLKLPASTELENSSSSTKLFSENSMSKPKQNLSDSLFYDENNSFYENTYDNDWLTNETMSLEIPLIKKISEQLQLVLRKNENFLFSHSPNLLTKISEEIVRMSRDEPGGVTTCRVHLNLVSREKCSPSRIAEELRSNLEITSTKLGSSLVTNSHVVETSKIEVYLLFSSSILSRLQSIVRSFSLRGSQKDFKSKPRPQKLLLLPDCVLVKQKLFRSNNKKSVFLLKSIEN